MQALFSVQCRHLLEEICRFLLPRDLISLSYVNKYVHSELEIPSPHQLQLKQRMMNQMKRVTFPFRDHLEKGTFKHQHTRYVILRRDPKLEFTYFYTGFPSQEDLIFPITEDIILWCRYGPFLYRN